MLEYIKFNSVIVWSTVNQKFTNNNNPTATFLWGYQINENDKRRSLHLDLQTHRLPYWRPWGLDERWAVEQLFLGNFNVEFFIFFNIFLHVSSLFLLKSTILPERINLVIFFIFLSFVFVGWL